MKNFIKLFLNSFLGKDGKQKYQLSSKPRKLAEDHGITFSFSRWSPAQALTDSIFSGFANEITEEKWTTYSKLYPEGFLYYNEVTDEFLSASKYQERLAEQTAPQPTPTTTDA